MAYPKTTWADGDLITAAGLNRIEGGVADNDAAARLLLQRASQARDTTATEPDLDISDASGNVIARLVGGGIKTKNFDSETVNDALDGKQDQIIVESEETVPDLDIADEYGNVILRMQDAGFETKGFRGFRYRTFRSAWASYSGAPLTLTVNRPFKKGDKIVLHVERGAMPWDYGAYVSYYAGDKAIVTDWRGDCAWLEHTVVADCETVTAVYAANAVGIGAGTGVQFEVSLMGDLPVQPTVVTVRQDGGGDYTTLRAALDAIGTAANDVLNPYRIEIWPGTYDVLADYTDEEIAAAAFDQTSFVGPKLVNGMHLVGMGTPDEVVLTAALDMEEWDNSIRGVVSTLNCQGTCGFENLTLIAYNIRYCVHDDYHTPIGKKPKRLIKNCVFRGYDVAYTPCTTYGAGTSDSGCDYEFIDCDFGDNAGVHTVNGVKHPSRIHLTNCTGHGFRIGDNDETTPVPFYSEYRFDNCDFLWINQRQPGNDPHVVVRGSGGASPLYQLTADTLYETGDVCIIPNRDIQFQGGPGTVVRWYSNTEHGPRFTLATSADDAAGIVVWADDDNTYVQTRGYVRTDRTGITSFSPGDYVGVSSGAAAIVQSEANAFGRIAYVDNTGAGYIRLKWR